MANLLFNQTEESNAAPSGFSGGSKKIPNITDDQFNQINQRIRTGQKVSQNDLEQTLYSPNGFQPKSNNASDYLTEPKFDYLNQIARTGQGMDQANLERVLYNPKNLQNGMMDTSGTSSSQQNGNLLGAGQIAKRSAPPTNHVEISNGQPMINAGIQYTPDTGAYDWMKNMGSGMNNLWHATQHSAQDAWQTVSNPQFFPSVANQIGNTIFTEGKSAQRDVLNPDYKFPWQQSQNGGIDYIPPNLRRDAGMYAGVLNGTREMANGVLGFPSAINNAWAGHQVSSPAWQIPDHPFLQQLRQQYPVSAFVGEQAPGMLPVGRAANAIKGVGELNALGKAGLLGREVAVNMGTAGLFTPGSYEDRMRNAGFAGLGTFAGAAGANAYHQFGNLNSLDHLRVIPDVTPTPSDYGRLMRTMDQGLGANPFAGRTFAEIDQMFQNKGYNYEGPEPYYTGKGNYVNPQNQRPYHPDPYGIGRYPTESSHFDVKYRREYRQDRQRTFGADKRRYFGVLDE